MSLRTQGIGMHRLRERNRLTILRTSGDSADIRLNRRSTSHRRLEELFQLVLRCLDQRTLVPITQYSERVAGERFKAGFDIAEVQTAFNVLEEAIWHVVIPNVPPDELIEASGLVGTVLGAGKDALARTWVQLATSRHVPSLNLDALFEGSKS